jgi:hypothetical protein
MAEVQSCELDARLPASLSNGLWVRRRLFSSCGQTCVYAVLMDTNSQVMMRHT